MFSRTSFARTLHVVGCLAMTVSAAVPVRAACRKRPPPLRPYATLEVSHGGVKDSGYTFSTRLVPTLAVGKTERLRGAVLLGASFVDSDWSLIGGARGSYRVLAAPLDLGGLDVFVEGTWGADDRRPLAIGVALDLGTVVQVSARGGVLGGPGHAYYETGIGVYVYRPGPPTVKPLPAATTDPDVYAEIEERAATAFTRVLVNDEGEARCDTVFIAERAALMQAGSLEQIQENLRTVGLGTFAGQVLDIVVIAEDRAQERAEDKKAANAFRRGMLEAVNTVLEE